MNILIILPPSLPHVLCSTAVIRCLKRSVAGASVHVLVPAPFMFLLAANPHIDTLLPTKDQHIRIAENRYNAMIDLAGLEENRRWAKEAGVKYSAVEKTFFPHVVQCLLGRPQTHVALQYLAAARPLGVVYDGAGLDLFLSEDDKVAQHDIPTSHSAGYVAVAVGNEVPLRVPLLETFCKRIPFPVLLAGGAPVFSAAQQLARLDAVKVYNGCGKFSDGEVVDLLRRSRVVVSADGGWLAAAAALGKKTVVLQTGKWSTSLLPPFYAQHLLQTPEPPYAMFTVPRSARFMENSSTEKAPDARAQLLVEETLSAVQKLF